MEKVLQKASKKTKTLQFAMSIPALDIRYSYSSTKLNQCFHSASVGKLMTAVLVFMAIDQSRLGLETKVQTILEPGMLDLLSIVSGEDHQGEITVRQLLGHLSGINDYFESKAFDGAMFINDVLKNPDTFWKPRDLVDFTRNRQNAVARPDEKFFYSDTGYVLLGLIVEAVYGMPFHQALELYILEPAGMNDTSLCFYGDRFDPEALAPLLINGVDVHLFTSLSCDFSGGGLSTTTQDLMKFLEHLQQGRLVSTQSLGQMAAFTHRYRQGLYYGLGMMQTRFEEFFFLLKNLPRLQGHLGVTGVHAWYDPMSKATFVMNVGNTRDMVMSFRLLIQILQMVDQEIRKK